MNTVIVVHCYIVSVAGFLELVNNMLTSGMVPALFPDDEREAIIGQVYIIWSSGWHFTPGLMWSLLQTRDEATKANYPHTKEGVWSYFVQKAANNLHIVLAMSPVGDTLKTRCRNFPGLVNNTSIDWFTAWPKQALHAVASQFLAEVNHSTRAASLYMQLHILCFYSYSFMVHCW